MNWDIISIMGRVIERATTYQWRTLRDIQQEYTLFMESESNDRKDAVVEDVDLSSPESLFRASIGVK